jgi:hypothetical protein
MQRHRATRQRAVFLLQLTHINVDKLELRMMALQLAHGRARPIENRFANTQHVGGTLFVEKENARRSTAG